MSSKLFLLLSFAGLTGACASEVDRAPSSPRKLDASHSRWSFELPRDGTPNDNGYIGPFCCTGVSAVVESDAGADLGYVYFFASTCPCYTDQERSWAPDVQIKVAGRTDLDDPSSDLEKNEVDFLAEELTFGASRS